MSDHLCQEEVLRLAVDAGQVRPLSLLTTDRPAGRDVVFVRHQKVAPTLELGPGVRADHWRYWNIIGAMCRLTDQTGREGVWA